MSVYKAVEWEICGRWYCGDCSNLPKMSNDWMHPVRILGISIEDFMYLLKNTYNTSHFHYDPNYNVLIYSWDKQSDMRKFKNYLNAQARKKNYCI